MGSVPMSLTGPLVRCVTDWCVVVEFPVEREAGPAGRTPATYETYQLRLVAQSSQQTCNEH